MSNMISDVVAAATAILCENNNDDEAPPACSTISPTQDKPIDLHRSFTEIDACVNQSCLNVSFQPSSVKEGYANLNNFVEINAGPLNGAVDSMSAKPPEETTADKQNGENLKERQSLKCSKHILKRKADRNKCPQESKHAAFVQASYKQPSEHPFSYNDSEFTSESFGQVTSDRSYCNNAPYEMHGKFVNESPTMTRTNEPQSYAVSVPQRTRPLPCANNLHATPSNHGFPPASVSPTQYSNSPPQSVNSSPSKNGQKTVTTSKFMQSKTVTTTKNFKPFNPAQTLQGPKTIVVGNQIIQLPPNSQILSKSTVLTGQSQIFNSQPFPGSSTQLIPKVSQIVQSSQVMRPAPQYFASPLSYQFVQSQPHIITAQNFSQPPIQLVPIHQGLSFQQHPIIINSHQGTSTTFLAQDTSFVVQQPPQVEMSALPVPNAIQHQSQPSSNSTGSPSEIIIDDSEKAVSLTNSPGGDAISTEQASQPHESEIEMATTPPPSPQHRDETVPAVDLSSPVSKPEPTHASNTGSSSTSIHEKEHKSRRGRPRLYERDPDTNKPIKTKRLAAPEIHDECTEHDVAMHSPSSVNGEDNVSNASAELRDSICLNELDDMQNVNGTRKHRGSKSQNDETHVLDSENRTSFTEDESLPLSAFSRLKKSRSSNSGFTKESSDRNVMTHIVEGFIIRESLEPFPNLQKIDERDAHQKKHRNRQKSVSNAIAKEKDSHLSQNDEKENKKKSKINVEPKQYNQKESTNKADEKPVTSTDSKRLKEDPESWTIDEVSQFVLELSNNVELAESFRNHEVDGRALFLVKEEFLMQYMNMKLGPALKLCSRIAELKKQTIMNQMPTVDQL